MGKGKREGFGLRAIFALREIKGNYLMLGSILAMLRITCENLLPIPLI
jgi:hypothetical protein